MSPRDTRTSRRRANRISSLMEKAGHAARGRRAGQVQLLEALENRVLLAGDYPSFNQVFYTTTPLAVAPLDVSSGYGERAGLIESVGPNNEDVVLRFTAPATDFVRVWADALTVNSTLDSRIEIWQRDPSSPNNAPTTVNPLYSSSNNGSLTSGPFRDGWVGFIAQEGQEYYVVVASDSSATGNPASTGPYLVRVYSRTTPGPSMNPGTGVGTLNGNLNVRGSDIVYKVTTPSNAAFNSVLTAAVVADPTDFDPRLDIYDDQGNLIVSDSDTGSFTDSFAAMGNQANRVFYVRVRSDRIGDPAIQPSTGAFQLRLDGIASTIAIDPVIRYGQTTDALPDITQHRFYKFQAQGTGLTIISLEPTPLPPIEDSALRIYNSSGALIGFNELPNAASRMFIQLTGGQTYYLVVENFNGFAGGIYKLSIEAHHTFVPGPQPNVGIDDHQSTPTGYTGQPPEFGTQEWYDLQRHFQYATPIIWGDPQPAPTPPFDGLPPIEDDHSKVRIGRALGRIHTGGDTDLFQFVPPVDMLGTYEGHQVFESDPPQWSINHRPAQKLQILTQIGNLHDGLTFINTRIRVFDSNFEIVYDTNNLVLTPFQDPAGMLDPASFPPELPIQVYGYTFASGQPAGIDVWGGEVYYLEVSSTGGSGRYDVEIMVDAEEDGIISEFDPVIPGEGQWEDRYELRVNENTGEARNYVDAAAGSIVVANPFLPSFTLTTGTGYPHLTGRWRSMDFTLDDIDPMNDPFGPGSGAGGGPGLVGMPGTRGRTILQSSDFGVITSPTDKDLYMFRALYTGMAEIWINTTQIADTFLEGMAETEDGDPETPPVFSITRRERKTYNSPLDSALRVFDNDFQQIGYNNDNGVTAGESDVRNVGGLGNRTFFRRDARVVIPVEAGKNYFIQVESGQLQNFRGVVFPKTDWRHATGSYELLVNSMPNLNFVDDHINANSGQATVQATPIGADLSVTSNEETLGSVDGRIQTVSGVRDSDTFKYISPGTGTLTLTLNSRDPFGGTNLDSWGKRIEIYDEAINLIGVADAPGTEAASISILASQGSLFYFVVLGTAPEDQGHYTLEVSGAHFEDDYASMSDWFSAHVIDKDLYDYDKFEIVPGRINNPGESDIFTFDTIAFDVVTVTVTGLEPSLRPKVDVYEISEDHDGNPVLLRIAHGAEGATNFSVTAPPRTSLSTGRSYTSYFVIVYGLDPNADFGDYEMRLDFGVRTDDHPDEGQWDLATPTPIDGLGNGANTGVIELAGDTDMFQFVAPAQGPITITITPAPGSTMRPAVRIYNADREPVLNEPGGQTTIQAANQVGAAAVFNFVGRRNATYFIVVEGVPGGPATTETGAYGVAIVTPIPDDHANVGEFEDATEIRLSSFSGNGAATGVLETPPDSDLFFFTTLATGNVVVNVTVPQIAFRAFVRLFDGNVPGEPTEIGFAVRDGGPGDEDGLLNGRVVRTMTNLPAGNTYYVLVSSDQSEPNTTGPYTVFLAGPLPPQTDDDHPNAGEWDIATLLPLQSGLARWLLNGDTEINARIDNTQDSDLFYFISQSGAVDRPQRAFIQVVTASGDPIDVSLSVFTGTPQQLLKFDALGGPGTNAQVEFDITQSQTRYWVLVTGLNQIMGDYTLRIDTAPSTHTLFYPEGFTSNNINEYITIGNPDPLHDVTYSVRLRFEDTSLGEVTIVSNAIIPAASRRGVTVSEGTNYRHPAVPAFKPYAIIIESNGFLAANISHYDFGSTLGEAFTSQPSTMWSFARGTKFPGQVNDFLVYYNPNPTPVRVTLTAYTPDGQSVATAQVVQGHRRFGWNFNNTAILPTGDFAFTVTSAPVEPSHEHVGIVAALSHYDLVNQTGYGILGDPAGGATMGVVPQLLQTTNASSEVTFFNSSNTVATIGIIGRYIGTALPNLTQSITLNPFSSVTLTAQELGMAPNNLMGLRYQSNTKVTVLGGTRQFGATDATQANNQAATSWFWGDAFMNRVHAGKLYFEDMFFYNPNATAMDITLKFHFNTGITREHTFTIGGGDFARIPLHQLEAILGHAVLNRYSVEATAPMPFVAKLSHYDLALNGGWGSKGAPLGLTNPLATIA